MVDINSLIIEKVKEVTMFNSDGSVRWAAQDISPPKITVTSESREKIDAMKNVISRMFTGKKAEISFDATFFSLSLIAAQSGSTVNNATVSNRMITAVNEQHTIGITNGVMNKTITLDHKPYGIEGSAVKYIYIQNKSKSLGMRYEVALTADESHFAISEKKITLPTNQNIKDTDVVSIYYSFEATNGAYMKNTTQGNYDPGLFRMFVQFKDVCDQEIKYSGVIEFPFVQVSPDCEIGFDYDSTYSVTLLANKKYCSGDEELFTIYIPAEGEGEDVEFIKINSFDCSSGSPVEVGSNINLTWTTSDVPKSITINDNNIPVTGTSGSYSPPSITKTTSYTLVVTDNLGGRDQRGITVVAYNNILLGASSSATANQTVLDSLTKTLSKTIARKFDRIDCGTGAYIYYAFPDSLGEVRILQYGVEGGFEEPVKVQYTNSKGYKETYKVYRSSYILNGMVDEIQAVKI